LRKRLPGETPHGSAWKEVESITNSLEETIAVNEYFAARPEMMLGEMRLSGRMYGRSEPTLEANGEDLKQQLQEVIARLPEKVFRAQQRDSSESIAELTYPAPEEIKPNAFCIVQGNICIREGDNVRVADGLNSQTRQRIRGLIQVRDAVRQCLRSQLEGHSDEDVTAARQALNLAYDSFVAGMGQSLPVKIGGHFAKTRIFRCCFHWGITMRKRKKHPRRRFSGSAPSSGQSHRRPWKTRSKPCCSR